MSEQYGALMAHFAKMRGEARDIEAKGEVLMRAAFRCIHPDDLADGKVLQALADSCFQAGRRIRDSIPVPTNDLAMSSVPVAP